MLVGGAWTQSLAALGPAPRAAPSPAPPRKTVEPRHWQFHGTRAGGGRQDPASGATQPRIQAEKAVWPGSPAL